MQKEMQDTGHFVFENSEPNREMAYGRYEVFSENRSRNFLGHA